MGCTDCHKRGCTVAQQQEGDGRGGTLLPQPVEAVVITGSSVQVAAVEKACVISCAAITHC